MDAKIDQIRSKSNQSLFMQAMNMKSSGLVHYILDRGVKIDSALQDAINSQNYDIAEILFSRIYRVIQKFSTMTVCLGAKE